MSILQLCPDCTLSPTPLDSLSHHPTHLRCRLCKGEWFSALGLQQKVSAEFFKRAVLVFENQPQVRTYPCLSCSQGFLHAVYPSFRFPSQEDIRAIPKPNPLWTNVPSYCQIHLCSVCHGSWATAENVAKLPQLLEKK